MLDHPWLRPLPAALVMVLVGFWGSFAVRESGEALLGWVLVAVLAAGLVLYLTYALVLVVRRRRGRPAASATPWWLRLIPQAIILGAVGVVVGLFWALIIGLAAAFGAPPDVVDEGLRLAVHMGAQVFVIALAIVVVVEVGLSVLVRHRGGSEG